MKRKNLASVLKLAEQISKAVEAEAEEILEDAEAAVKESTPACSTKKALVAIENKLEKEGVEALFEKKLSRAAMVKSASEALSDEEIEELADKITDAIVEEFEDVLKDADEVCDDEIKKLESEEDAFEIESKLKGILEKKLASKGIYANLERKITKKETVATAEKKKSNAVELLKAKREARK